MARLARLTPWLLAAGAVAFAIVVYTAPEAYETPWRLAIGSAGAVASLVAWWKNRMPLLIIGGTIVAGLRVVVWETDLGASRLESVDAAAVVSNITVGIAIVALLGFVLQRRRGSLDRRDAIDLLAVTLSGALCAWILTGSRLLYDADVPALLAIGSAAYLPTAVLVFTFVLDLIFADLKSNRAAHLIACAAAVNVAAAGASALYAVGLESIDTRLQIACYGAAFLLLCAGITHRDAPELLVTEEGSERSAAYTPFRLVLTGACLIVPGVLVASLPVYNEGDVAVRVTLLLAIVCAVIARLFTAVRSDEEAKRELLGRLHLDELTGLPTRARFVEIVSDVLEKSWRSAHQPTIIQLNLDRFKNINDSLGHYEANQVLIAVGQRLKQAADRFGGTVARSGGDDFVVLVTSTVSTADANARLDEVRAALAEPIAIADASVFVTASYGVAVAPHNRTVTAEEFMRRADIATHSAKADGRNSVTIFDESMQARLAHRMDVEHALHGAIGRNEMQLYYQPIIDTPTGQVSGFEALMRWRRTDGTLVSPADFIPIAEETGVICELGSWALGQALRELRGWINDGVVAPTTTVSVNVSPRQIADPNFADLVRDTLADTEMPPHLLWLEMTESMMLDEPDIAQSTLRQIRSTGVRLALDDFGTGFSSLSLLQQFPMQRIKIDRAFVSGIDQSNDRSLVRTIVAMAQSMGLDLVAEGVETIHQLQALRDMACDKAQGYLISRPVPADAMRSTMVALEELSSMPLFGATSHADVAVAPLGPSAPTLSGAGAGSGLAERVASISSRPLGQPVF